MDFWSFFGLAWVIYSLCFGCIFGHFLVFCMGYSLCISKFVDCADCLTYNPWLSSKNDTGKESEQLEHLVRRKIRNWEEKKIIIIIIMGFFSRLSPSGPSLFEVLRYLFFSGQRFLLVRFIFSSESSTNLGDFQEIVRNSQPISALDFLYSPV